MSTDPADTVIEQAAKVMSLRHHGRESSACNMRSHEKDARALHDAGLLADPADRDELAKVREERDYHHARADVMLAKLSSSIALRGGKPGDFWKEWHKSHCGAVEAAERAEAEVARLKTQLAETRAEVDTYSVAQVAELRATVAKVRELHILSPEEVHCWECDEEYPCPTIRALDGAGERP